MNRNEILKWHSVFYPDNSLFEIRLLGGRGRWRSASGYFTDVNTMLASLEPILTGETFYGYPSAYFTLNALPPALFSREQHNCFVPGAPTTTDADIVARRFVLLDFDPVRQAGISSSTDELAAAKHLMGRVYNFLKLQGFHDPVMAASGNGYHLLYRVDMPADEPHTALIKSFLEAIARRYSNPQVDVDTKVFNPARICKLYGTQARKGADTPERPWREAAIKYVPDRLLPNPDGFFHKAIAALPPAPEPPVHTFTHTPASTFNLPQWLTAHGIEYRLRSSDGITKYQLRTCPWEDTHSTHHEWDSAICVMPDGKIIFTCFHAHCTGRRWEDVRRLYEPSYEPRATATSTASPTPQKPAKTPQILPASPERGPLWYQFDEIPDVNLDALPKINTGITGIDRSIRGLYLSEVSIISGTNSSGKSSFLNTLLLNAVDAGHKAALWSGELRPDILKTWVDMVAAGRRHLMPSTLHPGDWYVPANIKTAINRWLHGRLVLFNNNYGTRWEQIFSQMQAKQQEGFTLFVLDNLMKLDIDILGDSQNQQQKKLVEQLGEFAKQQQVHIILVAHPRKTSTRGIGNFLRKDDIAGSAHISDLADDVFIIHRNNNDFRRGLAEFYGTDLAEQYRTEDAVDAKGKFHPRGVKWNVGNVIEICKNRLYGAIDQLIDLYYEPESRRFKNTPDEDREYGWNTDATRPATLNFSPKQALINNNDLPFQLINNNDQVPF